MKRSRILDSAIRGIVGTLLLIASVTCATSAQQLQKPKVYQGNEDIENWVMSEKLDGIRGYWNGRYFQTRNGKRIVAPLWFSRDFPAFALDGEFWSKRSDFEFIQATILDQSPGSGWQAITYNIFEVPDAEGDFPARLQKAAEWFSAHPNRFVKIIPQIVCKDRDQLQLFLEEIKAQGGEGVIIKDPRLDYHTGRSSHVLKVKHFDDMEGTVIAVNPGRGKYTGMMGSLTLELDNGLVFKLGTGFSDKVRRYPPAIGSIVTFKYLGFSKNGLPRFASFLRLRGD